MIKVTFNFLRNGVWLESFMVFKARQEAERFITEKLKGNFTKIKVEEI